MPPVHRESHQEVIKEMFRENHEKIIRHRVYGGRIKLTSLRRATFVKNRIKDRRLAHNESWKGLHLCCATIVASY